MAKGYTTAANVAAQLGRTLTADQITYCTTHVIPAVEEWIDTNGGKVYGEGVVVAEQLYMSGPYTWLSKAPVSTLTRVRGYFHGYEAADIAVIDPAYYNLVDTRTGQLWLPGWQSFKYLEADYTPDPTIPDRIKLAASIVTGVFMRTAIHPESEWLTDYASAQDVRLKFREIKIPDLVYSLLDSAEGSIVVA